MEHHHEPPRIAVDDRHLGGDLDRDASLGNLSGDEAGGFAGKVGQRDGYGRVDHVADAAQFEQLIEEPTHLFCACTDHFYIPYYVLLYAFGVNAGLPAYSGPQTAAALLDEIFKQRRIELFLTGVSLEDSRRLDRPPPPNPASYESYNRNRNFYPYPQTERDNNPNTPANPTI